MNDPRPPSSPTPSRRPRSASRLAALALLALSALTGAGGARPLHAVLPEYANLLAQGRAAYDRRDFPTAIRNLHLACFGMLDEPKVLADCLARLALAQDRANDLEGFRQTFQRLAEVEDRFAAYSQGGLPADLRTALEPRLVARIPVPTLEGSPGFRFLVPKKPDAVAAAKGKPAAKPAPPAAKPATPPQPAPTERREAGKAPAPPPGKTPPAGSAPSAVAGGPAGSPLPTGPAPAPSTPSSPPPPAAAPNHPLTDAEREMVAQSREKLATERTARELTSIFDALKEIADSHPESRETQHAVGQAAYRLSRWPDAVSYFKRGGDPGDEQAELLFYLAVSLYESGDSAGAAATLKRALPNLQRTPYVDKYAKKILGQ